MLDHYDVVADPARVGDPDRKGTVENAINYTQNTGLKGRKFESIETAAKIPGTEVILERTLISNSIRGARETLKNICS
jgi:hypothetical protein